jgi:hypothetical protein
MRAKVKQTNICHLGGNAGISEVGAELWHHARHETESFKVLHDVAALVGDEKQIKIFEGLIAG